MVIANLKNDDKKIELLKSIENEWDKVKIISTFQNDNNKITFMDMIKNKLGKIQIILSLKDEQKRKQLLGKKENKPYKELLKKLQQKNSEIMNNIDVRILQEKYLRSLGKDKINLISCYPNIQEQILSLSDKQYKIFIKCINNYLQKNKTEEWTQLATYLLENIEQYSELINNIKNPNDVDITKLTKIMQDENIFSINNIEDIDNYEKIKKEKCDKIIQNSSDIQKVKEAVFQKLFGHSAKYAQIICDKYGEGINDIEECDEKYYVLSLMNILKTDDLKTLKNIYENCSEVEFIDKSLRERKIKNKYAQLLNENLFKPSEKNQINVTELLGENIQEKDFSQLNKIKLYNAGTDFRMIVTSVGALGYRDVDNFQKSWNRNEISSQNFCASYIRNDCIKTVRVVNLCYGFINMSDDTFALSGISDIGSSEKSFYARAYGKEKYYSPDILIDKTDQYNEIDFRRIQGGEKKQPDYIVAFKRNGKIDNLEKILKASNDWDNKLPIVIVDCDECEKTKSTFKKEVKIDLFKKCYDETMASERSEIVNKMKQLYVTLECMNKKIEEFEK